MKTAFSVPSFAIGIALGGVLATAWFLGGTSLAAVPDTAPTTLTATSSSLVSTTGGALSVETQAAGTSTTIASLTVPPPGVWVAVREVTAGQLGNVLGAARVGGPRTDFVVPLLRATAPGTTYAVELYRDSGDNTFDLSTDSVYVDFNSGERVVAYFTTLP